MIRQTERLECGMPRKYRYYAFRPGFDGPAYWFTGRAEAADFVRSRFAAESGAWTLRDREPSQFVRRAGGWVPRCFS